MVRRLRLVKLPHLTLLSLVTIAGLAVGMWLPVRHSPQNLAPHGGRPLTDLFDSSKPMLLPGHRVGSVGEAAAVLPTLAVPQGRTPSQVWVSDTGEGGLRFGPDLVETVHPLPMSTDVRKMYEVQASDWGFGYVDTIQGHVAWIIADHPGNPSPGMNAIRVGFGASEIRLYSKMPIQELLSVAATLSIVQA